MEHGLDTSEEDEEGAVWEMAVAADVQAGLAGSEAKRGDEQRQWRGLKMK